MPRKDGRGAPRKPRTKAQEEHAKRLAEERADKEANGGVQPGLKPGQLRKAVATPENQLRTKGPICGHARSGKSMSGEGVCCQPAGWGTNHKGVGWCKLHGGNSPTGEAHAAKQRIAASMPAYGAPINIGPHEAILEEVHRTAGHVQWLHEMIQWLGRSPDTDVTDEELEEVGIVPMGHAADAITQATLQGIKPSIWLQMYQAERKHLMEVCKTAVTMGCAERTIQLAEDQGKMLAMVILAIFRDNRLGMNHEQIGIFPTIAREHMAKARLGPAHQSSIPATIDIEESDTEEADLVY